MAVPGPVGNGSGMSDHDRIRKPARDAAATDPVQGEDIPTGTDEAARRRAGDGELEDVPQPPGEAGSEARRGAGNDLGAEDPTATEVDQPD